jgi:hypothetical protein
VVVCLCWDRLCKAFPCQYQVDYQQNLMSILGYHMKKSKKTLAEYRSAKPEQYKAARVAYDLVNIEKKKTCAAAWYLANKEKSIAAAKAWWLANPMKSKASKATWSKKNLGLRASYNAKRHSAKLRATPLWANMEAIEDFYITASALGMHTGEQYNVDHIYPLQSDWVCGLHVENNLQILTAIENARKGNRCFG